MRPERTQRILRNIATVIAATALVALVGVYTDNLVTTAAIKLVSLVILSVYGWLVPENTEKPSTPEVRE